MNVITATCRQTRGTLALGGACSQQAVSGKSRVLHSCCLSFIEFSPERNRLWEIIIIVIIALQTLLSMTVH
jgi:hypothetical protein